MEPPEGFEPPTGCLQNSCSTTELRRRAFPLFVVTISGQIKIHFVFQVSRPRMSNVTLFLIHGLMTASVVSFYLGYSSRYKNNKLHRLSNTIGVLFNLTAAIYLLYMKYMLGGVEANGIFPAVPRQIIDIHRFFAAIALVLMLVMAYSGYAKKRVLHRKLHYVFLPLYTIVYISGLFIFQTHSK